MPTTDGVIQATDRRRENEMAVAQETMKRVRAAIDTAATRQVALGLAVELMGPGLPDPDNSAIVDEVLAVAERFREWIISGQDPLGDIKATEAEE